MAVPVKIFSSFLNHTNEKMTKEEVAASLERMVDDPDDWYGEASSHLSLFADGKVNRDKRIFSTGCAGRF